MADPFAMMNRSMDKATKSKKGAKAKNAGYKPKALDPDDPTDAAYLRAMHPDFDDIMDSANSLDYKTRCIQDADFGKKFAIPPIVEPVQRFQEHTNSVDAVCWGPDPGTFISASHDSTLKVWDAAKGKCVKTLKGHSLGVYHCSVSPNKKFVASCGSGEEKNALLWEWPSGKVARSFGGHKCNVHHIGFSSDGNRLASSDKEGVVSVHDIREKNPLCTLSLHNGVGHGTAFCEEDPNLMCSCGGDGILRIIDLREYVGSKSPMFSAPSLVANMVSFRTSMDIYQAHEGHAAYAAAFLSNKSLLTCGADNTLKRWDLRMGPWEAKCALAHLGHSSPLRTLAVTQDKQIFVTGCDDGSCRVWRLDEMSNLKAQRADVLNRLRQARTTGSPDLKKLQEADAQLFKTQEQLQRDGFGPAALTLNGHTGIVSGLSLLEEAKSSLKVLTSSWDQTVALFEVNIK